MADKFLFDKLRITNAEWEKIKISNVATRPNAKTAYGTGLSAAGTKKLFDGPPDLLRARFNSLLEYAGAEEAARAAAESARAAAEAARSDAEAARAEAEAERVEAEGSIASQSGRAWAEKQREDNEEQRNLDELERENNERQRNADELKREENEAERVKAEERRNTLVGDLDKALDELHAYAESLIGGGDV